MTRWVPEWSRRTAAGQSLVEFALAVMIFLVLLMAVIDGGRAVYQLNGASEAARELARATSVHPGSVLGSSAETAAVLSVQTRLVPGLTVLSYTCVDIEGATVTTTCHSGNWVRIAVRSRFTPVTPVLSLLGAIDLHSTASARIE
jgi:Flp pilus assembly protein TadG